MTTEVVTKRPARLDIVDMPRDKARVLGGLRQALCASFNYCRKYPLKMKVLQEVLVYVVARIDNHLKEYDEYQDKSTKEALEIEGKELGIDLDSRKSVENMTADLEAHKAVLAAKEAESLRQAKEEKLAAEKEAEDALKAKEAAELAKQAEVKGEVKTDPKPVTKETK